MKNKIAFMTIKMAEIYTRKNRFNIQRFADEGSGDGAEGQGGEDGGSDDQGKDPGQDGGIDEGDKEEDKPNKTYTQKDVDEIVQKRLAREKKNLEKQLKDAKAEGEKLAKMNAEQKQQYEMEKLQRAAEEKDKEIAELKAEALKHELGRTASEVLQSQHKITATQDILDFVVGADADETNERIKKFVRIINADRKAVEVERAKGKTRKDYGDPGKQQTAIEKRLAKYQ